MLEVLVDTAADAINGLKHALELCTSLSAKQINARTVLDRTALNKVVNVFGLLAVGIDTDFHVAVLLLHLHKEIFMHGNHIRVTCQLSVHTGRLRLQSTHDAHQLPDVTAEGVHLVYNACQKGLHGIGLCTGPIMLYPLLS